jgi:putative chitinase
MKAFFDVVRDHLGPLKQSQVTGMQAIYDATKSLPTMHQAYILATAWHETAFTVEPIYERGKREYFDKYEAGTKIGKALGNTQKGDGYLYRGRGFVQLTGRRNYALAGQRLGVDLIKHPDKALDLKIATTILVRGMTEGWFTGKKLSEFNTYDGMRRTVNGTDRADKIAAYARVFQEAVLAQGKAVAPAPKPVPAPEPPRPGSPPAPPAGPAKPPLTIGKVMAWVVAAIIAAIAAFLGFGGK